MGFYNIKIEPEDISWTHPVFKKQATFEGDFKVAFSISQNEVIVNEVILCIGRLSFEKKACEENGAINFWVDDYILYPKKADVEKIFSLVEARFFEKAPILEIINEEKTRYFD